MKKIKNIDRLRGVLRKIIFTQDRDEIKNFNSLYDYSNIKDMSLLWNDISLKITDKKIDWKNIKFPTLDMINVEIRKHIFYKCPLFEINLINTGNIKNFYGGFGRTNNLEKISLDLIGCEKRNEIFYKSNVKEVELFNTQNIQNISYRFSYTENLEKMSLDLIGCEEREDLFYKSNIKERELKNTQNIKKLDRGFEYTENLEKLNNLYLDNCENITNCFAKTNLKELKLYNTGKIKKWIYCFWNSNIEEVELDMNSRETCENMFKNRKVKKINLKNCENIKNIEGVIRGRENLDYLEMNILNIKNMNNFIDDKNNIKYLKLIGIESQKLRKKEIKKEINKLFSRETNSIPHIELVKNNTTFNIISDNNSSMRLEKKEKKEKMVNIKKENEEKLKSKKEYSLEINI